MPLTIHFVRHGESQANIDRVFANRVSIPADLTPAGVAQARALARTFEHAGVTHVYSSPLPRARQTAEIVAAALGVPCVSDQALREYDVGDFEGLPYIGEHAWRWDRYEWVEQAWRDGDHAACHPGGESLADLGARFLPFMAWLAAHHADNDVLVAVGHGGFYRAVLPLLMPSISTGYALAHTLGHGDSVVAVHDDAGWHCRQWGEERFPA
jgi:2,3-bisphosphoglycerate-dependent phosphoglycerate mutase